MPTVTNRQFFRVLHQPRAKTSDGCGSPYAVHHDNALISTSKGLSEWEFESAKEVNSFKQKMQDETELIELQQTLAKAWLSRDRAMVECIIAPDWISTYPDGHMTDRAGVLAQVFETGVHEIHGLKIDDIKVRVFGDAAVVTGRTHGVGAFEGNGYEVVIRFTDTFVRRRSVASCCFSRQSCSGPMILLFRAPGI